MHVCICKLITQTLFLTFFGLCPTQGKARDLDQERQELVTEAQKLKVRTRAYGRTPSLQAVVPLPSPPVMLQGLFGEKEAELSGLREDNASLQERLQRQEWEAAALREQVDKSQEELESKQEYIQEVRQGP